MISHAFQIVTYCHINHLGAAAPRGGRTQAAKAQQTQISTELRCFYRSYCSNRGII